VTSSGLSRSSAATLLASFAGLRVVVVGDVFLDKYLVGRAERLSREGPVPVLAFERRFTLPGGAANPARNITGLGGRADQIGVVGDDDAGRELREALDASGIGTAGLVVDPGRPTTVKTRVVAEGLAVPHQVARIDLQVRRDLGSKAGRESVEALLGLSDGADAVLVSHYRSGVATDEVCEAARNAAVRHGVLLTADAQGDLARFEGFDLVRVGRQDAVATLGAQLSDDQAIESELQRLREALGAQILVLGRGRDGMSLVDGFGYASLRPANVSEVFDVTGAGDTVIAVMTLALAAGASARAAALLANHAAGVVVRRLGVVAPMADEILAEMDGSRT
jgi:rfaE bifunctional protein kinase chain/domain